MTYKYSVNLWGSHPDQNNDDCWTGKDFETLQEALEVFENPWNTFDRAYYSADTAIIELETPSDVQYRKNPEHKVSKRDNTWRKECAMQAGMAFGIDAYNEWME